VNLVLLYIDRFDVKMLDVEVCNKIFIWAFYPRVAAKAIYDTTVANYAGIGRFQRKIIYQKMFQLLITSANPRSFIASINTDVLENNTANKIIAKLEGGEGNE
jgi:hypothetical protein